MMDNESTLIHDHSTLNGRLSLLLHRLKWKCSIFLALLLVAFAVGVGVIIGSKMKISNKVQLAPGNFLRNDSPTFDISESIHEVTSNQHTDIHKWTVIKQPKPGFVEVEGCENGLFAFEGFVDPSVNAVSAKSLRIRNLVIDAAAFSQSLAEWTSLESLVIENVWIDGNFSRVALPSLKKFIFHQYRNGNTDQYKQEDILKQILFFDKRQNQSWDLYRDLLSLNVTIQVTVEGTKLLDIEPELGEININTHSCEEIFRNFHPEKSFRLSSLSLSWCELGGPFLEKIGESRDSLKYLFLNNAVPGSTAQLAEVTTSMRNLKELHIFQRFHCDWPGYEIFLNVSDLSPSVETLSVTNLDISFVPEVGAPFVRNLSLDQYVGKELVDQFETIFPNLKSVALFNVTKNLSYPILHKVVTKVRPELVIVTDLERVHLSSKQQLWQQINNSSERSKKKKNTLTVASNRKDVIADIEGLLSISGVPDSATSFLLEKEKGSDSNNGTIIRYVGKELTSFQRNLYRFTRLAFRKIDTYTDYVIWDSDPK